MGLIRVRASRRAKAYVRTTQATRQTRKILFKGDLQTRYGRLSDKFAGGNVSPIHRKRLSAARSASIARRQAAVTRAYFALRHRIQ
jgi:hypothetical protein